MTALGISLIVAAVALFIAEAHLPSFGLLAAAGVVLVVLGILAIFDEHSVTAPVIVVTALLVAALLALGINRGLRASREPFRTGQEEMIGAVAEVRSTLDPLGQVLINGALWRARLSEGTDPLPPGARVRVEVVDGLTLQVAAAEDANDEGAL